MLHAIQSTLSTDGPVAALDLCHARVQAKPDDADAWRHLGQLQAFAGNFTQALASAQRACDLAPADARCCSDLGRVYALQHNYVQAARCFEQAVLIDPRHADGWHNLGTALRRLGDIETAFAAFKKTLALDSTRADTWLNLGNLLIKAGQYDDAVECFERAARHDPSLAAARSRLATRLSAKGQVKRAAQLFRQSLGLDPDQVESWFGFGQTLEDLGQAEAALDCYLNVIARHACHAPAIGRYLALANADVLREDVLAQANATLHNTAMPEEGRALIGYGLVKYHSRRKDHASAAAAGRLANQLRRQQAGPLDRTALAARVDNIMRTCNADFFAARERWRENSEPDSEQPVFIVGLPRSGTTLTEQILAAHPRMHGAGELPDLSRLATGCVRAGDDTWRAVSRIDARQCRQLASRYLHALRDGAPHDALRISDKSPLNFFQLGFATLLFPGARVIHCTRNARDNALSIWMENFNPDQRYATDFDDLAFYHGQYQRLMEHWRNHLPLPILDLHYEATVANLETQARNLIRFLDVPWDAHCLDFHKTERAVQTPSRWQVRQPIYTGSVERWRTYHPYLPELDSAFSSDPS